MWRMDRRGALPAIAALCFLGMVVSQTTLTPAVTNTTLAENVTGLTLTPTILSSTTPGCSAFNTSTCEACAPGSHYDNIDGKVCKSDNNGGKIVPGDCEQLDRTTFCNSEIWLRTDAVGEKSLLMRETDDTLLCVCCSEPGLCLFPGACMACTKGFYQPLAGQQRCLPCNRGFYTNFTGSPLCHPCPVGSFNNNTGAESCTRCSPGFFASQHSSTSCSPCVQGSFCNTTGCSQCSMCPGGSESLQAAALSCTPCRPGMHKASHQALCQICASGYYQIHWGQENCNICPENHYCPSPDVNPIQCPNDAFCPEGSLSPGYCMETFFRKSGETCELAPVTIALLVIGGGVALLSIILMVLRRRRDADGELTLARAPLLRKERPQGRYYGIPCDAEPVYAGW